MKKKFLSVTLLFAFLFSFIFPLESSAQEKNTENAINLVDQFVDAINEQNVLGYISLFTDEIQQEMYQYLTEYGSDDFFQEQSMSLGNTQILSEPVALQSAQIADELQTYENVLVIYAETNIQYKSDHNSTVSSCAQNANTYYRNFILVQENGIWKLSRVSTPNIKVIVDAGEGFNTISEETAMYTQTVSQNGTLSQSSSLSCPTSTTIYFTKSGNYGNHMGPRASINFQTYLKNVIPNEWTVSYYGPYPAYLRAGAMGSKMYAWYYTVYPKWNCSPFYACMKDNCDDQNYDYSSYNSLNSTYRGYVDGALSDISTKAMVISGTENIFEVHYHATDGSQHSGQMSATGCLSKAKAGDSYETILHYYYDNSTYTGNKAMSLASY